MLQLVGTGSPEAEGGWGTDVRDACPLEERVAQVPCEGYHSLGPARPAQVAPSGWSQHPWPLVVGVRPGTVSCRVALSNTSVQCPPKALPPCLQLSRRMRLRPHCCGVASGGVTHARAWVRLVPQRPRQHPAGVFMLLLRAASHPYWVWPGVSCCMAQPQEVRVRSPPLSSQLLPGL